MLAADRTVGQVVVVDVVISAVIVAVAAVVVFVVPFVLPVADVVDAVEGALIVIVVVDVAVDVLFIISVVDVPMLYSMFVSGFVISVDDRDTNFLEDDVDIDEVVRMESTAVDIILASGLSIKLDGIKYILLGELDMFDIAITYYHHMFCYVC